MHVPDVDSQRPRSPQGRRLVDLAQSADAAYLPEPDSQADLHGRLHVLVEVEQVARVHSSLQLGQAIVLGGAVQ